MSITTLRKITGYISQHRLSDTVELLEKELGIDDGEILLFFVAIIQVTFVKGGAS